MKKLITLALALMLIVALAAPALAAHGDDITAVDGTSTSLVTYTVTQSFTVTIPATVTIAAGTTSQSFDVGVLEGARIPDGEQIIVTLTGFDGLLRSNAEADTDTAYELHKDTADGELLALNGVVMTHAAGVTTAATQTLFAKVTGTPRFSGNYTDQLTFTVSVAAPD